jgi:Mn-dependent DtxR family transcriptional regulator
MASSVSTALSQALIAFTIEFDNEFEHRVEHRTAARPGRGVWLTSMVMWSNFMRLIPTGGVPLREVEANARITNLAGLQRWGYVSVAADGTVQPTPAGRRAQDTWRPLAGEIERRWRERFGEAAIEGLRAALSAVADPTLPPYLPVLKFSDGMRADHVRGAPGAVAEDLAALLSQALLAFTLDYEAESTLSLAMGANILRVLSADGAPKRDVPARSGVSKEAVAAAVGYLERKGFATIGPARSVQLTEKGVQAQAQHVRLMERLDRRWDNRLADVLIAGEQLALGLQPYPDGWRASNPYRRQTLAVLADPAAALPQYPMVLHRGGYPDGC